MVNTVLVLRAAFIGMIQAATVYFSGIKNDKHPDESSQNFNQTNNRKSSFATAVGI
jgi:hypothetical protein